MKYLIGIDGGGTGSRCVISDLNAKVLYRCKSGPTNFLTFDVSEVCKNIYSLISTCRKKLNISSKDIKAVVIGTAGAGREKDALFLEKYLRRYLSSKKASIKLIKVVSDGIIALEGAFPNDPGCILISGTGSIIFGKNKKGEHFRLGGYGNKIGDEGSGYSIGRKGLNAVSKDFDGRGKKTFLTNYLKKNFKISSGQELINKVYRRNFNVASFAPFVLKAAEKKDRISIEILNNEADQLIQHIKTIKRKVGIKNLRVTFSGSLISNKDYFSGLLRRKIKSGLPGVEIIKPDNPPEVGAILLALKYLKKRS